MKNKLSIIVTSLVIIVLILAFGYMYKNNIYKTSEKTGDVNVQNINSSAPLDPGVNPEAIKSEAPAIVMTEVIGNIVSIGDRGLTLKTDKGNQSLGFSDKSSFNAFSERGLDIKKYSDFKAGDKVVVQKDEQGNALIVYLVK